VLALALASTGSRERVDDPVAAQPSPASEARARELLVRATASASAGDTAAAREQYASAFFVAQA
jgi:hypothetical protein